MKIESLWPTLRTQLRIFAERILGSALTWSLYYRTRSLFRRRAPNYSIGVVTYIARFESHFIPLLEQLIRYFHDTEILVTVNGYHDQEMQDAYLKKITSLLKLHHNVIQISFRTPMSIARLWNQLVLQSSTRKVLVFNDDLLLHPSFRRELELSPLLGFDVGLINSSWSHFFISRAVIDKVGWFDERFLGVGNEDEDYESRLALIGMRLPSVRLYGIDNIVFPTQDFSYGKDVLTVNTKYCAANKEFFDRKWDISLQEQAGYTWVRILNAYVKPKAGMETPDFYGKQIWERIHVDEC